MRKSEITTVLVELDRLRSRIKELEGSQGPRKRYQYSAETEAVRWAAVCLSRALRPLTEDKED